MTLALALAFTLAACGEPTETEEQIAARELDAQVWAVATAASDCLQSLDDLVLAAKEGLEDDTYNLIAAGLQGDKEYIESFTPSDNSGLFLAAIDELQSEEAVLDGIVTDSQPAMLYVGSVRAYTANARVVYEKTLAYVVNGEDDAFDDFVKYYEMVDGLTENAVKKRREFLSNAGFSDSEIDNFPAEVRDTDETASTDPSETTVAPDDDSVDYSSVSACFADVFPDAEISCIESGSNPQVTVKTALSSEDQPENWAQLLDSLESCLGNADGAAKALLRKTAMGQIVAADGTILASGYNGKLQFDLFAKRAADQAEADRIAAEKAAQASQNASSSSSSRTVYVTPTGSKYHYSSSCNGGSYSATTLDDALSRGLTACKKCA